MELTLDEALQKAIEAHKAGQVQEADRLYTAILKAQPKHPDSNHNMGVLAAGVGKAQEALPFFKTALEANPSIGQYWLSYIDALIKLDRITDAKTVFDQAKKKGASGEAFNQRGAKLNFNKGTSTSLEAAQLIKKAIIYRENGEFATAIKLLTNCLSEFSGSAELLSLLAHCYLLNDDLENVSFYLGKAKEIDPHAVSVGLNDVRLLMQNNKMSDALVVARKTMEIFPENVEGMGVIGACLRVNKEIDQSLLYLDKAISLNPDYAEALINRGLIKLTQKDKLGALSDLETAHRLKPHMKQIWDLVISLNAELNNFEQAISLLSNMAKSDPSNEKHFENLGRYHQYLGNLEAALKNYTHAVKIKPDFAEAYSNMGVTLQDKGDLEAAIDSYKKALKIKPDYADAYNNLGAALRTKGDLKAAIDCYIKALKIRPDYAQAYSNMGVALKGIAFTKPISGLMEIIISLLDQRTPCMPYTIAPAAISLLKLEPTLKELLEKHSIGTLRQSLQEMTSTFAELPLLSKLMSVCPIADLELEAILVDIRLALLSSVDEISISPGILRFQSALALQCFTNEYIYNQTDKESELLKALEVVIEKKLSNDQQPSPHSILCLASYKALHEYEWCDALTINTDIEEVFVRQVQEPKEESRLKANIPILQEITDKVSSKVREQYEANPYPRWVNLGLSLRPKTTTQLVKELNLRIFDNAANDRPAPNILIAGCGTGRHSIVVASRFKDCNVLAIDLSLSSLAYAKRKTEELGLQNIDYMQADILSLNKLDKKFDIIESVGVLHHMDDPMAGWRVLTDCIEPGGLMNIGLYSELARQHIVKIREEISQSGIGSSDNAMKLFRTEAINSDKAHYERILTSGDLYSLSTFRDLLFHVQEHRFTICQIKDCLSELGLKFCGFESDKIVGDFKLTNTGPDDPYDLDKWDLYEKDNPHSFVGMYQFWCQKVT
ncbi:tetratricopeptide repeat protein [Candidatus Njordibacter sp. Uisw_058]|uniref:tetratricopeptide repeat protein n=1 Tax=Candidatus Njordibacter sp. Uisw_058 TaxID=3230974 RepID=UPI003D3FD888